MSERTVFISHLTVEKEAAFALKELLEKTIGKNVRVYVSSDAESIPTGESWLENIVAELNRCVAVIILCSEASIERHWIYFEAGAGSVRKVPVMPVCFAGVTKENLPGPWRQLQSIDALNEVEVCKLVRDVARQTDEEPPLEIDPSPFIEAVTEIERRYIQGPLSFQIYPRSAEFQADLPGMMKTSRESLIFSGINFNVSMDNCYSSYKYALESGIGLTICSLRPESSGLEQFADLTGEDVTYLREKCRLTYANYDRIKRHAEQNREKVNGRLKLLLTDALPVARSYAFDHETDAGRILYTPYLKLRDSKECPSLLFHAGDEAFTAFIDSTLNHLDDATLYFDSHGDGDSTFQKAENAS